MNIPSIILSTVPVPGDIPLPQPLPHWLLVFLLVFSFLIHILFVNLMLGGVLITLWLQVRSLTDKKYDLLARQIAQTITVNKSLAVVMGVAPLLTVNTLYTIYFYSANTLTGQVWISIVPLVTAAFLLLYWHKYSWDRMARRPKAHIALLAAAAMILLFIPLIFLTNINLMQFPARWSEVSGFLSAMFMWNVIPRYFHFLCASLAVTGLFLFAFMRRKSFDFSDKLPGWDRTDLLNNCYGLVLWATVAQLAVFGPLNFFTLPWASMTWGTAGVILTGAATAIAALIMIWMERKGPADLLGRRFWWVAAILTVTVVFMGSGRHIYRAVTLEPHQKSVAEKTARFAEMSREARLAYEKEAGVETVEIRLDEPLNWMVRTRIVRNIRPLTAITRLQFDLDRQIIILKFESSRISETDLRRHFEELNLKIVRQAAHP